MIHENIQDEKACSESARISLLHDNKMLLKQLDVARKDFEDLHKDHEELQVKSKADVKLLVKEVKSLRISQIELKQELSRLMKEKLEVEVNSFFTKTRQFHHFAAPFSPKHVSFTILMLLFHQNTLVSLFCCLYHKFRSGQVFNVYPTN